MASLLIAFTVVNFSTKITLINKEKEAKRKVITIITSFFSYSANEALHLSEKEKATMIGVFRNIEEEEDKRYFELVVVRSFS